ncbi:Rossmann-like and DUF2520 domain-containing protein [Acetivibrio saccincola]|uniref:NADP oxidoreductase n=1 Tax=Acetivibrio saccincola TaxID=1677857 RepID=A0A2K9E455_9FIRM|nr:Rossmann-like and DUF2520 domain-containing protein [Acetivibrio saccincola]AUG58169.1 Rossmann-like domain protein [Acetivibrio saccincola]NLW26707.1 DUF2520 domain-containing protein [Acetivibrio saccincola]PQQ68051.1 NADP oxidoreductase [Acetivibrio saccincola]HOA96993.1 DUF2520 domain-containing protein [Acetivibrio saccincola]HQD27695.1 DUF2520 domain-containing protein [Acetivibrio saccincola]
MNVGIVGAGKVGYALALAFYNKNINISGIYSKSSKSALELNKKISADLPNDIIKTVKRSEIVFLSVSDNSIRSVAEEIASKVSKKYIENKVFFHLSGALTSDELKPLKDLGGHTASLHPAQTFASKEDGWKKLYNIYFGFEGCNISKEYAKTIVEGFNGTMVCIEKEDKTLYHAAACIISNYTVTLSYIASEILNGLGFGKEAAGKVFLPLIKGTVENLESRGVLDSITGPIERGDDKIIAKHIEKIKSFDKDILNIYKMLGQRTLKMVQEKGILEKEKEMKLTEVLNVN